MISLSDLNKILQALRMTCLNEKKVDEYLGNSLDSNIDETLTSEKDESCRFNFDKDNEENIFLSRGDIETIINSKPFQVLNDNSQNSKNAVENITSLVYCLKLIFSTKYEFYIFGFIILSLLFECSVLFILRMIRKFEIHSFNIRNPNKIFDFITKVFVFFF
jgi:hypothetical protein